MQNPVPVASVSQPSPSRPLLRLAGGRFGGLRILLLVSLSAAAALRCALLAVSPQADFGAAALLATYQKLGLLTGDPLVVIEPVQRAKAYRVGAGEDMAPAGMDQGLLRDCIAYYQTASRMLRHGPARRGSR
jgi:hypothetical protein